MEDKKIVLLADAPVHKAILKLSIPMIMGMMVQVLYNLVDTYFIGRLNDANQLAAANMGLPIFVMAMGMASIVGTGAASYISRCLGKKDTEAARQTASLAVALLITLAIVMTLIGGVFCGPIVKLLGADGATYDYTYQYARIMLLGSGAVIGNFALGQLLRAEGNAMRSVMGMVIGTVLNIVLDPLFIFGFDLGVSGAALATIIGNTVGLLYYIGCFIGGKTLVQITYKAMKWDTPIIVEIFKIGVPSSLNQILVGTASIVTNNLAMGYGVACVAAIGVASKWMMIGTFIFIGFSSGCQPLIGYNYGAGALERVQLIIKRARQMTAGVGMVLLFMITLCAPLMISAFSGEQEVIAMGATVLRSLMWSLPFLGGQMIATSAAQSMGKATPAILLSIARQGILYMPLVLLLNVLFGYYGFVFAQAITDMIMCLIANWYMTKMLKNECIEAIQESALHETIG